MQKATAMIPSHIRSTHRVLKRTAGILSLVAFVLLSALPAGAQGTIAPVGQQTFFTADGAVCSGCLLYTYEAGGTTPLSTYTVVGLTPGLENANPIVLNSAGINTAGGIYFSPRSYKLVLKTSAGATIWSQDFIPATTANGTITFPATQVISAGANTLDDYEEGTWTPTIGGSGGQNGQVYVAQAGTYIKVGRLVVCTFYVSISTLGTITTNVQIKGLPFTAAASAVLSVGSSGSIRFGNMTSSYTHIGAAVEQGGTAATLYGSGAAATAVVLLAQTDLAATTNLSGTITYLAAD